MKKVILLIIAAIAVFFLLSKGSVVIKGEPEKPEETPKVRMRHYVITYDASDCPGMYAVRVHLIFSGRTRPAELIGLASSLEEARKMVPEGLYRMERDPRDDRVIVEVWM